MVKSTRSALTRILGASMGYLGRSLLACASIVLAGSQVTAPAPVLSASALVMGGTNQILSIPPNSPDFIRSFVEGVDTAFIEPSGLCVGGSPGCALVAIYTPEELRFITGWDDLTLDESVAVGRANLDACLRGSLCMATSSPFTDTTMQRISDQSYVVQGVSQSSIISTYEKSDLIAHPVAGTTISFILVSNPNRPNGGFLERFVGGYVPLLGITFNGATPTNSPQPTPLLTIDIARQYDGWVDFPTNPLNLLADVNALLGAAFLHNQPLSIGSPAQLQGYYQDTTYYLVPSPVLPLLIPLAQVPILGRPLALALDPPLRVLVEAGYDRATNPGQPTPARWLYGPKPIDAVADLARSVPTGWDDAIAYVTHNPDNRPFHTQPQGVYGVGGPPVYAGAIDPYVPVPEAVQPVVAQHYPAPTAAAQETTAVPSAPPDFGRQPRREPGSARPDRALRRTTPAASQPRAPAADPAHGNRSSSKIATARVHPADAA